MTKNLTLQGKVLKIYTMYPVKYTFFYPSFVFFIDLLGVYFSGVSKSN